MMYVIMTDNLGQIYMAVGDVENEVDARKEFARFVKLSKEGGEKDRYEMEKIILTCKDTGVILDSYTPERYYRVTVGPRDTEVYVTDVEADALKAYETAVEHSMTQLDDFEFFNESVELHRGHYGWKEYVPNYDSVTKTLTENLEKITKIGPIDKAQEVIKELHVEGWDLTQSGHKGDGTPRYKFIGYRPKKKKRK